MKKLVLTAIAIMAIASVTNAAVVDIESVTASHGGDRYALGVDAVITALEMDKSAGPDDPSKWTATAPFSGEYTTTYKGELQMKGTPDGQNGLGFIAFNLGSSVALQDMYLWNVREGSGKRGVESFNVYHAVSPDVALPAQPNKGSMGSAYDFSSGGWTRLNGDDALTLAIMGSGSADGVISLGGISAQYIGIEILSNHNGSTVIDGNGDNRVGLAEVAFTAVPEPATMALLGLGGLGFIRRRRA